MSQTTTATTTATTKKPKKAQHKPKVAEWPKEFNASGIKTRTNFTKPPKAEDKPESYVQWTQVSAKDWNAFFAFINKDQKRALKFALAGYNAEQRQSAAFGEQRISRMVDNLMEMNPKLSREKAEARVRAALAEE